MASQVVQKRRRRLYQLGATRDRKYIARAEARWFWDTFKKLKATGWDYMKAWDMTVWALEESYSSAQTPGPH